MRQLLLSLIFLAIPFFSVQASEYPSANRDSILILLETADDEKKAELYLLMAASFKESNTDSSLYYTGKALTSSLADDNPEKIAMSYFTLGKIQMRRDSIFATRDAFYKALSFIEECESCIKLEAEVLLFLGKSYSIQDNYSEAINYLMQCLKIAEENDYQDILSDVYDDIGFLLLILENYDQAMHYFEKAVSVNLHRSDRRNYATTLRNIGFIYNQKEAIRKSLKSFEEAYQIYDELGDDWGMATTRIGQGDVLFSKGDFDSALILYDTALIQAEKIDIRYKESGPLIQAYCYNRLGETYIKLGNLEKALTALRKSSDLAEKFTMPGRKADASKLFSSVYQKQGNTTLALDYYHLYDKLSDSIINARNVSKITKLELEYQYLKKQKEQEIEQVKKEAEFNRNMLFYRMSIVLLIVLTISLVFIFILYRKNQRNRVKRAEFASKNLELEKDHLQKELDFKNKELTTSVMYQLKKNNFIAEVAKKFKEIIIHLSPTQKKNMVQLVKDLESNMSKETWEEFEYRFNSVHNDFYDNLLRDFPGLTPNELKLCAFLRLNMTSKDISTITYTTPQSITVARHRLRTKLGLSRDDNLITFLAKY